MLLYGLKLLKISHHPPKLSGHRDCSRGYSDFSFSHDLSRPSNQSVMWLYVEEPIMISYYPVNFGGHKHCCSRDIKFLTCHVTSHDHVIKDSCDFMGRSPSQYLTTQPSLVIIGIMVVQITCFQWLKIKIPHPLA